MIPLLVQQAIEIKINFENFTGILQSDYEYAYACGKLAGVMKLERGSTSLSEFGKQITAQTKNYHPKTYQEENLIRLITIYQCENTSAEELEELIKMGYENS